MGRRVLITGLGTFWGGRVAKALEADPDVEVIVGVDTQAPKIRLERTEFVRADQSYSILARIVKARLILVGQDVPPLHMPAGPATDTAVWRLHDLEWPDGQPPEVAIGRDDVAEIIFTSGATAEPKGVIITHRNILANIVLIYLVILGARAVLSWFPVRGGTFLASLNTLLFELTEPVQRRWIG